VCASDAEPDDEPLERERRHLMHARRCLEAMREAVRTLDPQAGNAVSTEYLKAELFRRAQALLDDPSTPLFFGRINRTDPQTAADETFYIGRRHVRDPKGEPVVVDWRADISRAFYRASAGDPMGVHLRRRFGFSNGVLTSYEEEHLDRGEERDPATSAILTAEIERPRVGPMRDIVATIQPDQDHLVRTDLSQSVCIQGAPGTGKTAVGLHRAAYLLYAHREQLRRSGVLVVGPNRSFLGYIGALLPALGELDVEQVSVADLPPVRPRGVDPADVDRLKGDIRMADVVRRAVFSGVTLPADDAVIATSSRRWRLPTSQLREVFERELTTDTPYDVTRDRLTTLLAEAVRRRMEAAGAAPDDRMVRRLARGADITAYVDRHWPAVAARETIARLLGDPLFLRTCADGVLDTHEQLLLTDAAGGRKPGAWTTADAFLVDEASGLLRRSKAYAHIVVDEAQDLSAMQCRAVARRCPTGSVTVLGDLAQATAPAAVADWARTLTWMGQPLARVVPLTRGYRVPAQVLEFANRLLPALDAHVAGATSLRHSSDALRVTATADPVRDSVTAVSALLGSEGSIGIIAADDEVRTIRRALARADIAADVVEHGMESRVTVVPVTLCKGLEFDHVVLVEPGRIEALPRGLNWLYVALTRAVTSLTVLHGVPLPRALQPEDERVESGYAARG
jgi:DNA helicase IV